MEKQARKRSNNWVITVESRNDQHQEIILQQSPSVPTSFSNGVGTRMALIWMTGSLLKRNLYRTILMGTPPNLICSSSLREVRR